MPISSLALRVRMDPSGPNRCPDRVALRLDRAAGLLDSLVVSWASEEAYGLGAGWGCCCCCAANTPGLTRRCTSVSRTPKVAS